MYGFTLLKLIWDLIILTNNLKFIIMKKQNLKNLTLNKVAVSNFEIKGGRAGESFFNTVCEMCETLDCPPKNGDR